MGYVVVWSSSDCALRLCKDFVILCLEHANKPFVVAMVCQVSLVSGFCAGGEGYPAVATLENNDFSRNVSSHALWCRFPCSVAGSAFTSVRHHNLTVIFVLPLSLFSWRLGTDRSWCKVWPITLSTLAFVAFLCGGRAVLRLAEGTFCPPSA